MTGFRRSRSLVPALCLSTISLLGLPQQLAAESEGVGAVQSMETGNQDSALAGRRDEVRARMAGSPAGPLHLAIEDLARTFGDRYPRAEEFGRKLDECEAELRAIGALLANADAAILDRALHILGTIEELQREALTANPLVCEHPILFVVRPQYRPDHHNTETFFQAGEINTGSFEGGGALKYIDFGKGGQITTLLAAPEGIIRDPEVHFDGARVLFSMRKNIADDYHVYEIAADGSSLRRLTSAPGVTDMDPIYLPDDSIVFSSTREPKYCMCNRHIMANLHRMEADGANIRQIGKSTLFEGHGALLPDGRVLYDRWEYVDRNFGDAQGLWTVNPDGTGHAIFWGNNTWSPGGVLDARPVPGTHQVICVFGSCHDRPWGAIALIDRRLGLDDRGPVVRMWPKDAIGLVSDGTPKPPDSYGFDLFQGVFPKYEDPYPLSDRYFLCSRMTGQGEQMGIYLFDVFGNEIPLHVEGPGCFDPMPLGPRRRPMAVGSSSDASGDHGWVYVANVYEGTHMQGVTPDSAKYLRVVESPEKRFWTPAAWNGQGQHAPGMGWHDFNNKRILGTVPVESDGSVYVTLPAGRFVYFQLLDENGMMIQSMRSGTAIQPGERLGCVGCHENRRSAPSSASAKTPLALRGEPRSLDGWYGPARMFSYRHEIQPVWDRYCVGCHDYGKKAGNTLNLAGDTDFVFNTSYNELWRKKYIASIGAGPAQTQQAYSWGSHASKLVETLRKGHGKLLNDKEAMDRVVTWIDINGPFYPDYSTAYPDNLAGRCPLNNGLMTRLAELTGIPFASLADHGANQGPQICFERPELSPCLAALKDSDAAKYEEALTIIIEGRKMLASTPPVDMSGFQLAGPDAQREEKYTLRLREAERNTQALLADQRAYDPYCPADLRTP